MKHIRLTLLMLVLVALAAPQVQAQTLPPQRFDVQTPPPPLPKTRTARVSILDQGISDITRALMLRLEYRQLFPTEPSQKQGYVFSAYFNHLFGSHPALMNRFVQAENAGLYPNYNDLGVGVGYRWAYENFALIPQAHFRDQFAFGQNGSQGVSQHLFGFEPGLRLEYWIYPEVARLSVDYGFNVPFLHLANQPSDISPFSLSLNRLYTELSYRLFDDVDVMAGFYWWQVPAQLGSGGITSTTLANVTGFQIGGGMTF